MIVLSRKAHESIVVEVPASAEVTITVVEVKDDKVSIGIESPREVAVHRLESHQQNDKQPDYALIINRLRAELNKSQKESNHYRELLGKLAMEPWQDVTPEQLEQEAREGGNIDDILNELEQACSK
jgi:carbon storage regulator